MQIYRRMNIGTAKPTVEEMAGIPHHMIDVADPDENFSVARYQEMAEACIADIHARGKRALLVGGTGLYLRALRQPMAMGDVSGNDGIRAELEAIAAVENGKQLLHDMLADVDPDTAGRLHLNDVRRVVRAIEVCRLTGIPFSKQPQIQTASRYNYRVASLTMERALLYERIEKRVDIMVAQGLIDEVRGLLESGVPADCQDMKAIGYKEIVPYLRGETSWEETDYLLKLNTRHYAKRQLTWMRREEDVLWVEALAPNAYQQLEQWFTQGE
jgi:tRNA dimethylallyltransferase